MKLTRLPRLSALPTGGELVAGTLAGLGLRDVFSVSGSQVLPVWDALGRDARMRLVLPRTERHGAFAAEGYGAALGAPAVLLDTLGVGVPNEVLGLASAQRSSTPVLAVSPCHPPGKRRRLPEVFQGLDASAFFSGLVKETLVVDKIEELRPAFERAVRRCRSEPPGVMRVEVSFPLLFQRHPRLAVPGWPASRSAGEQQRPRDPVLVLEAPDPPVPCDLPRLPGLRRITPGLGEPGYALPFALGVAVACPRAPVVVVTRAEHLQASLGVLPVAGLHRIPCRLVPAGGDAAWVGRIADTFGCGTGDTATAAAGPGLTVVVGG